MTQNERQRHEAHHEATLSRSRIRAVGRRVFLTDLGRGAMALTAVGFLAACSSGDDDAATPSVTASVTGTPTTGATEAANATATMAATATEAAGTAAVPAAAGAVEWHRVNLGFVSAYVLVRDGEAATVDTGVPGSEGMIEAALTAAGFGWGDVGHVIVTHQHPDHQGSLSAVMAAATEATAYAGAADIPALVTPRAPVPVGNGDTVFGLDIHETPGHTAGHISVLDPIGGLLLAGDAINGEGGGVIGPNPMFSSDHTQALASVQVLAALDFETVLFGHGEPVIAGAADRVRELAATL